MSETLQFKKFLTEAKQNTFANGGKTEKSSRPHSKDYAFKKYNYYYLDSCIGDTNIIGEELVWQSEKLFWGMNYNGKLLVPDAPYGFISFLKEALRNCDADSPFRGPKHFENNKYSYECSYDGDIESFNGVETIKYNGEEIFKLHFHGGTLV